MEPPKLPNAGGQRPFTKEQGVPRWILYVLLVVILGVLLSSYMFNASTDKKLDMSAFLEQLDNGQVKEVSWPAEGGKASGTLKDGQTFEVQVPRLDGIDDANAVRRKVDTLDTPSSEPSIWLGLIQLFLPIALLIGFIVWMNRRAAGQMGGIMSIGRSRAKTYNTERPATTFADVAGYEGVKQEINEVVDFLKEPDRFAEVGARIPKGVLLVGPPGTGKTLIARAVAGEAGVPFLSVSGSDFMEMFVGVGASRVRDLFESARKLGRAIIFIDEIDSIGRKRGAGLGGGHDEREQTLNQMLSEMDGFEATEGIVMMAATNRPDILDPALLRPGRFDRQVVVPLPELEDRRKILAVHVKHKRLSPDIDLELVARGTPGMSGAELSNLVNEAALHAVRDGSSTIRNIDFESARDRVLMGQRRESMVLSEKEKQLTAYHEAGHAVCAAVLEHADPLHKVTILPIGMALGVTMQLPVEDRHSYDQGYLEHSIIVAMGGRIAERLVFGVVSTGANNDLVVSTERARKMVREWGMSERIGPMAWGSQGQVFLGEDLMSTRDYSDETARVIDEEVETILRDCEQRCVETLTRHRNGLDLVARALLEHETISGAEVHRLIAISTGAAPGPTAPPPMPGESGPTAPVVGGADPRQAPATQAAPAPAPASRAVPTGNAATPPPPTDRPQAQVHQPTQQPVDPVHLSDPGTA